MAYSGSDVPRLRWFVVWTRALRLATSLFTTPYGFLRRSGPPPARPGAKPLCDRFSMLPTGAVLSESTDGATAAAAAVPTHDLGLGSEFERSDDVRMAGAAASVELTRTAKVSAYDRLRAPTATGASAPQPPLVSTTTRRGKEELQHLRLIELFHAAPLDC